jgi:hypothetical protein
MTDEPFVLAILLSASTVLAAQAPATPAPDVAAIKAQLTEAEFAEYQRWVAIGVGGLPHTLDGYRTLQRLNKMLRSPLDVAHLEPTIGQKGDLATLKNLPARTGQRATIAPFAIPHRQTDQHNAEAIRERQKAVFDDLVKQHSAVVQYQTSFFETHNQAVFLKVPANGNQLAVPDTHGEVGHMHPTDGSMHFSLSPSDTVEVLAKGWGELHGLAGQVYAPQKRLPATYTMIYSPRTEAELGVTRRIIDAAIRFSALRN